MNDSNPPIVLLGQWIKGAAGMDGLIRLAYFAQRLVALGFKTSVQLSWTELKVQGGWVPTHELRVKLPKGEDNSAIAALLADDKFWAETDAEFRRVCAGLLTGTTSDNRTAFNAIFDTLSTDATKLRDAFIESSPDLARMTAEFDEKSNELIRDILEAIARLRPAS